VLGNVIDDIVDCPTKQALKSVQADIDVGNVIFPNEPLAPQLKVDAIVVQAFIVDGNTTLLNDTQSPKVFPKLVQAFNDVGITILSNEAQPLHIEPIVVKLFCALFGNTILLNPKALLNVDANDVIVQPEGIVILDIAGQESNVDANDIDAPTVVGNVISCNCVLLKQLAIDVKLGIDVGIIQVDNEVEP
jgi:hypothetical protein